MSVGWQIFLVAVVGILIVVSMGTLSMMMETRPVDAAPDARPQTALNSHSVEDAVPLSRAHSLHAIACLTANGQIHGHYESIGVGLRGVRKAKKAWRSMRCDAFFAGTLAAEQEQSE